MAFLLVLILLTGWLLPRIPKLPGPSVALPPFESLAFVKPRLVVLHGRAIGSSHLVVLTVTRDSRMFLNDKPLWSGAIQQEIETEISKMPDSILCLKIDFAAPYRDLIILGNIMKSLGIHSTVLAVRGKSNLDLRFVPVQLPTWSPPVTF